MRLPRYILVLTLMMVLSGCSYFRDEEYIDVDKPGDVQSVDIKTGEMIAAPDTADLIGMAGRVAAPGVEIFSLDGPAVNLKSGDAQPQQGAMPQGQPIKNSPGVEVYPLTGGREPSASQSSLRPPAGAQLQSIQQNEIQTDDNFSPVPIEENFDK